MASIPSDPVSPHGRLDSRNRRLARHARRSVFQKQATYVVFLTFLFLSNGKTVIYYEDRANVCFTLVPNVWRLWLPDIIMHAFLVFFLVFKAIATPRSVRRHILALFDRASSDVQGANGRPGRESFIPFRCAFLHPLSNGRNPRFPFRACFTSKKF